MESTIYLETLGQTTLQNRPQVYIDTDVEADGIAGHGSMLALGAVSPWGETFYREIKPFSEQCLPGHRAFCEEHGLERERLLDEAPDLESVMSDYTDWLHGIQLKTGRQIVMSAFNAAFDWAHIDYAFTVTGHENPHGIAPFDLKSYMIRSAQWDWTQTSKSRIPELLRPDGNFTHNALEDAQYQQRIHFRVVALAEIALQT